MRLNLTVIDPGRPEKPPRHVLVEAAAGTTFGEVRARVAEVAEVARGAVTSADAEVQFGAGGRLLADDDVLGRPPLLRGALLVVQRTKEAGAPDNRAGAGAVELCIVSGMGAGRCVALGRGEHVIGRAASAQVRLEDPGVSRSHAVLAVSTDAIRIRDLQPTNRSRLDGELLPPEGAVLEAGRHLTMGSTTLVLGHPEVRPAHHDTVAGEVRVHRQPRFRDARSSPHVVFPEPPSRPGHARVPLLASLAPLVLSAVLATVLSSPALLLFALMSPVLLLGQWWSDRRAGRTSYRRQLRDHAVLLAKAGQDLAAAAHNDAIRRREEQPDLAYLQEVVQRRGTRLWERRPTDADHLVLRVGSARQAVQVQLSGPAPGAPEVPDLPALVDLARCPVVGVAGRRSHTLSLAGAVVAQVAAWHTPRHVGLTVLADTEEHARDWEWAAHLPHLRDGGELPARITGGATVARHVAELCALVEARRTARDSTWSRDEDPAPDIVVVLDGASALRTVPGVAELLRRGRQAGVAVLCLDADVTSLPAEARASVHVDETGLIATIREDGRVLAGVVADLPSRGWLEATSRAMSPLVDATPEAGGPAALPREVSFVDLHRESGTDPATPDGMVQSWSARRARPTALLGRTPEGTLALDLAADGPHLLVGGTTGSGKSELLQALVAGLAVTNRPDEISFVLVDYKGGSAFRACARLPHTVGFVTDLDAHLTSRALASLDAEMKRRERLLARASARDLDEYQRAAAVCADLPPLARLVIVVDEFKALADELPDFVAGLVRIAALGRSLGLHLVLATQRPAGIVSADMRANVALRIALRVRDRADSEDIVECTDAAALDPRAPGRACLRAGDGGLRTVQTAYLGRPLADEPAPLSTRVVRCDLLGPPPATDAGDAGDDPGQLGSFPSELDVVVDAAKAAATALGLHAAPPPWLPPLPTLVTTAGLVPNCTGQVDARPTGPNDHAVALGLLDVPREQQQQTLRWRPDEDGHLGIAGGPRSGRTTAVVSIALQLARQHAPRALHLHVLQGVAGPCSQLEALPHVGTVADATDPALCRRLVARLLRIVDGEEPGPPLTVVLVDGWESLEESLAGLDHGATVDDLHRLLRDGPSARVWLVVTGGRGLLSGRLPGVLQRRLVLDMPDALDLTLAGIPPTLAALRRPPGRAVDLRTGLELQLAVAAPDASPDAFTVAVRQLAATSSTGLAEECGEDDTVPAHRPWRIRALPGHVDLTSLLELHDGPPGPGELLLGTGGDAAEPVGFTLAPGARRILVAGPHRSGRSTSLVTMGECLLQHERRVLVISPRRSCLTSWAETRRRPLLTQQDADELIAARRADPDLCVLVDDLELVDGSPVEAALLETARLVDDTEGVIVVAAELTRANGAFRGLVPEVSRDGRGLLLGATSPNDGDVLGVRLDVEGVRRPGRGHLVVEGLGLPVQVAQLGLGAPYDAPPRAPARHSVP